MKTSKMPKTIKNWSDKNKEKVDLVEIEEAQWLDCEDGLGNYVVWLHLKEGLMDDMTGTNSIKAYTVKEFMDKVKYIVEAK